MPSLDQFESYYAADEDAIKTAVQTGIVAPDTNVVLHFYRFQPEARDELFGHWRSWATGCGCLIRSAWSSTGAG